jgi:hypothetical protein
MTDHVIHGVHPLIAAIVAAVIVALATRVRVLPEVIDVSIIPTIAGVFSLGFTSYGAMRRFDPDRIARLSLGGTVLGGAIGGALLLIALVIDVM